MPAASASSRSTGFGTFHDTDRQRRYDPDRRRRRHHHNGEGAIPSPGAVQKDHRGQRGDTVTALDGEISSTGAATTPQIGGGDDDITGGLGGTHLAGGGDDAIRSAEEPTRPTARRNARMIVDYASSVTAVNGGVTEDARRRHEAFEKCRHRAVVFHGTETSPSHRQRQRRDRAVAATPGGRQGGVNQRRRRSDTLLSIGNDRVAGGATPTPSVSAARAKLRSTTSAAVSSIIDLARFADAPIPRPWRVRLPTYFDATTVLNVAPTRRRPRDRGRQGARIVTAADLTATDADSTNAQLVYTVTVPCTARSCCRNRGYELHGSRHSRQRVVPTAAAQRGKFTVSLPANRGAAGGDGHPTGATPPGARTPRQSVPRPRSAHISFGPHRNDSAGRQRERATLT